MEHKISVSSISARQPVSVQNQTNLKVLEKTQSTPKVDSPNPKVIAEVREIDEQELADRLQRSVSRLENFVQSIQRDLLFSIDEASGRTVITVVDSSTQEIIRQIPSEEILAISENIESMKGILFSADV